MRSDKIFIAISLWVIQEKFLLLIIDGLVKSDSSKRDGLWKKFDIRGVVSEMAIW